jgi:hypothetical protein
MAMMLLLSPTTFMDMFLHKGYHYSKEIEPAIRVVG